MYVSLSVVTLPGPPPSASFAGLFKNLSVVVDLSFNNLTTIDPDLFAGMLCPLVPYYASPLCSVSLSHNALVALPSGALVGMSLGLLDLSHNNLVGLEPSVLAGATLAAIDLSWNELQWLPSGLLTNMTLSLLSLQVRRTETAVVHL